MSRVIHFEIGAADTGKIMKFYSEVFGWKMQKWEDGSEDYWLVITGDSSQPGINGGVFKSEGKPTVVNTIEVSNVDESAKKIEENGGTIVVPKTPVTGVGWLVYFKDIEGNLFGIMQEDSNAK